MDSTQQSIFNNKASPKYYKLGTGAADEVGETSTQKRRTSTSKVTSIITLTNRNSKELSVSGGGRARRVEPGEGGCLTILIVLYLFPAPGTFWGAAQHRNTGIPMSKKMASPANHPQSPPITSQSPRKITTNHLPITS